MTIKEKVKDLQKDFITKIINDDFEFEFRNFSNDGWVRVNIIVEDFVFEFSVNKESNIFCLHSSIIKLNPNVKESEKMMSKFSKRLKCIEKTEKEKQIQELEERLKSLKNT